MISRTTTDRRAFSKEFWTNVANSKTPDDFLCSLQDNLWLMHERAPKDVRIPENSPCVNALVHEKAWGMVDFCLDNGAPLEARDKSGQTLVHALASKTGQSQFSKDEAIIWDLVSKAIRLGARCDTLTSYGEPLWFLRNGNLPNAWTNEFLARGSPPNSSTTEGIPHLVNLVQEACVDPNAFKNLASVLRAGGDPSKMGIGMDTNPLWNALQSQSQGVVDLLMNFGADPHAKDRFGRGILHHAPSVMAVSWAQGQGIDVNCLDSFGQTPLLFSMLEDVKRKFCDREPTLVAMIVKGASLVITDHQGPGFSSTPQSLLDGKNKSLWPSIPGVVKSMSLRSKAYDVLDEMNTVPSSPSP